MGECEIFLKWDPDIRSCDIHDYIVKTDGIEGFACFNATFCETSELPGNFFRHCSTPDDSMPLH